MDDQKILNCEQCCAEFTPDYDGQLICTHCLMQPDVRLQPNKESTQRDFSSGMGSVISDERGRPEFIPTSLTTRSSAKKHGAMPTARIRALESPQFKRKTTRFHTKKCRCCKKKYTPTYGRDFYCPSCSPTPTQKKIINHRRHIINTFNKKIRCYLPKKIFNRINDSRKLVGLGPEMFLEECFKLFDKYYFSK